MEGNSTARAFDENDGRHDRELGSRHLMDPTVIALTKALGHLCPGFQGPVKPDRLADSRYSYTWLRQKAAVAFPDSRFHLRLVLRPKGWRGFCTTGRGVARAAGTVDCDQESGSGSFFLPYRHIPMDQVTHTHPCLLLGGAPTYATSRVGAWGHRERKRNAAKSKKSQLSHLTPQRLGCVATHHPTSQLNIRSTGLRHM